jgi:hypothetical protein
LPWWVPAIVIVGAILMAAGGTIALVHPAMLAPAGEEINSAVRVYAGYLISRNLAIAAMLLGTLAMRARGALSSLMLLVAVIQILDAVIDCIEGRWMLVPGILLLGIGFSICAARLSQKVLQKATL